MIYIDVRRRLFCGRSHGLADGIEKKHGLATFGDHLVYQDTEEVLKLL